MQKLMKAHKKSSLTAKVMTDSKQEILVHTVDADNVTKMTTCFANELGCKIEALPLDPE